MVCILDWPNKKLKTIDTLMAYIFTYNISSLGWTIGKLFREYVFIYNFDQLEQMEYVFEDISRLAQELEWGNVTAEDRM